LFADFGEITHAELAPENNKTQKGSVSFASKLSCSLAIKAVHGMKLGGDSLQVTQEPKPASQTPTPPPIQDKIPPKSQKNE
jgi:hypothetical protein